MNDEAGNHVAEGGEGGDSLAIEWLKRLGKLVAGAVATAFAAYAVKWWAFFLPLDDVLLLRGLAYTGILALTMLALAAVAIAITASLRGTLRRTVIGTLIVLTAVAAALGVWEFHGCEVAFKVAPKDQYGWIRNTLTPFWYGFTFASLGTLIGLIFALGVDLVTGTAMTRRRRRRVLAI